MIKPIEKQHIKQIAKIHKENLPSFLTAYSLSFIERFYDQQLGKENHLFLGDFDGDILQGFVFGADNVDLLYSDFIMKHKIYFYLNTILAFLNAPKYIMIFGAKFFSKQYESNCKRQLVYITSDKKLGKKGVGTRLLRAFEENWEKYGYYELEVDVKNDAKQFYEKNDFVLVHEYKNWLEKKLLMGKFL